MKEERELVRVSLRLYEDDLEYLRDRFKRVGYNKFIREKVHRLVNAMREKENKRIAQLGDTNVVPIDRGHE